jgi:hypothetical protein
MKRILSAIGAAALGFAAMLLTAPAPSEAATYTLNFTGTVTSSDGTFRVRVPAGSLISGDVTFDPFNDSTFSSAGGGNVFDQAPLGIDYHFFAPTYIITSFHGGEGPGSVTSSASGGNTSLQFFMQQTSGNFELGLNFSTTGSSVLSSLAGLPNTRDGLLAFLGGGSPSATGFFSFPGVGTVNFDISAVTPILPTLPLFATALAGLGLVGWRRTREDAAQA